MFHRNVLFLCSKIPCKKSCPLSSTLTNELKFKINPVGGPVCSKSPTLVSEESDLGKATV